MTSAKTKQPKGPLDGIPELTAEQVKKALEEGRKMMEEHRRKERELPPPEKVGTCGICKGDVVRTWKWVNTRPDWIGPGAMAKAVEKYFHCSECGILYKFPPKQPQLEREADGE